MSRSRFVRKRLGSDPFVDLLFNALLGFTFLFLVALMFINPQARKGRVDLKAEYIISVTWPEHLADDIDLWVQDPLGEKVSYLNKEAGWLNLDRDDRGELNDKVMIGDQEVVYPINQEVVTIRGIIPGEYAVNLFFYAQKSTEPFDAIVKVEKVNPTLKTVFIDKLTLSEQDEEKTAVRFDLSGEGEIGNINKLPIILTPYSMEF